MVTIHFVGKDGQERTVSAEPGDSAMSAALHNDVPGVLADCGGVLSCATCHVHVAPEWMAVVGGPDDEEREMLELAIGVDETSRLSCQIELTEEMDGLRLMVPETQP